MVIYDPVEKHLCLLLHFVGPPKLRENGMVSIRQLKSTVKTFELFEFRLKA